MHEAATSCAGNDRCPSREPFQLKRLLAAKYVLAPEDLSEGNSAVLAHLQSHPYERWHSLSNPQQSIPVYPFFAHEAHFPWFTGSPLDPSTPCMPAGGKHGFLLSTVPANDPTRPAHDLIVGRRKRPGGMALCRRWFRAHRPDIRYGIPPVGPAF